MMDAEEGPVRAPLVGGDREVDGLQQHVRRRARLRLRRRCPMPERKETDLLHGGSLAMLRWRTGRCPHLQMLLQSGTFNPMHSATRRRWGCYGPSPRPGPAPEADPALDESMGRRVMSAQIRRCSGSLPARETAAQGSPACVTTGRTMVQK